MDIGRYISIPGADAPGSLPELLPLFTPEGHHHDGCATAHSPRQAGGAGGVGDAGEVSGYPLPKA
ncbi:MAG TPA: hypothetical protein PLG95_08205, partial [Methanoculleus sp.]|nr:hypothetical protein [Methanoculleus sp.]